MTSRLGQLAAQLGISLIALAAIGFVLLPTQFREQAGAAVVLERVAFAAGEFTATASCLLAMAVLWLQPRHPATPSLALCLTLSALIVGAASARPTAPFTEFLGLPEPFWTALTVACSVLVAGGVTRLSVLFPRPIERAEMDRLAQAWRSPPGDRQRGLWQRWNRGSDKMSMSLLLALPISRRRRRRLYRALIVEPRRAFVEGRPFVPDSMFGLPWTAWKLGFALAATAALAAALLPGIIAQFAAAVFGTVLVTHALFYFTACYRLSDSAERRKSLWAFSGLLMLAGLFGLSGVLILLLGPTGLAGEDVIRQLTGIAARTGWLALIVCLAIAIFRDGALDPALVIRRTALYGLIAAALSVLFVALEVVVARLVAAHVQLAAEFGPAIAAAGAAATFRPLHRSLDRSTRGWLDRIAPATALAEGRRVERIVVFSDLCGYTGLTAADERSALTLASLFHKKARRLAEEHGGRLVKTIGDAVLLEFADVARALRACIALPTSVAAAAETLELPKAALRTGAHFGEVVIAPDGDLFGGTVNLAARLQTTAAPGELIVSGVIARNGAAAEGFRFEHAGARALKNVPAPVDCYRVTAA